MRPPTWHLAVFFGLLAFALVYGGLGARTVRDADDRARANTELAGQLNQAWDSLSRGQWVQLRQGDTVVTVIRGRTWRWRAR